MHNTKRSWIIALALILLASITMSQVTMVSAQTDQPVGVVVEYVPGVSITVVDEKGNESQYALSTSVKILPTARANALAVGSFVTVIAPASLSAGKQMAVGIVVHPQVPNGWTIATASATAVETATPAGTLVTTPTGILATDTAAPSLSETPTAVETVAMTETATPLPIETLTETPTPSAPGATTLTSPSFFEWLRSLLSEAFSE